jgi:hypothetical protein
MIIPDSCAAAYEREQTTALALKEWAETRLRVICAREHWLFDDRLKSAESAIQKVETGLVASLADLEDIYAAMVVVPTHRYIAEAVRVISESFEGAVKPQRTADPLSFPYDDVHFRARLGAHVAPAAVPEIVRNRWFEVQVKTGLQYAWWRATHDSIYKGAVREWAPQRVASQARASLELLDGILADIPRSAELQTVHDPLGAPPQSPSAAWLQLWRAADRPEDVARFCQTVDALLVVSGTDPGIVGEYLESDEARPLVGTRTLTPLQAVVVAIARLSGIAWVGGMAADGRRLVVTAEMIEHEPELANVEGAHRVAL